MYERGILFSLVVVVAVLVLLSSIFPWWIMSVREIVTNRKSYLYIYAYGLTHNMSELRQYVLRHETPPVLMLAARVYLYALVVLALVSAYLILKAKAKTAAKILITIGAIYLLYTLAFLPVLYEGTTTAPEKIPMQGELWIYLYEYSLHVTTHFDIGYYLSLISSVLLIITGIITKKVTKNDGKKRTNI
jgi:hypothetical protein